MNVTSSLVQILKVTQDSWRQDLQQQQQQQQNNMDSTASTPTTGSTTALTHHRRTASGRVVFEDSSTTSLTHHRRTASGRVVFEDATGAAATEDASKNAAISKMKQGLALLHSVRFVNETRQRMKFVPFLLRNSTGLPLTFATLTSAPSKVCVCRCCVCVCVCVCVREREREREKGR